MNLTSILKNPKAAKIEEAIERKANSPVFQELHRPEKALAYIQTNLCMAYLFARYTIPTFASHVFHSLPFRGPTDDKLGHILEGIIGMVQGELFNNNIFERPGECHSHYFDIVEAFQKAGGPIHLVDEFIAREKASGFSLAIKECDLWNSWSVRHAFSSQDCYTDPLATFIMIPATEELSPRICARALENLSTESRFDAYRTFLQKHVELDDDDHGPAALGWLETYLELVHLTPEQIEASTAKVLYLMTGSRD